MKYFYNKVAKPLILVLTTCALLFTGCKADVEENKQVERNVKIKTINEEGMLNTLSLSGNVTPIETVKLSFKLDGVINEVIPEEGSFVKNGELIASLKTDDYALQKKAAEADKYSAQAGVSAAESQYEAAMAEYESAKYQVETEIPSKITQAKAQLDLTQATYDRVKTLYENGISTKSQFDEISAKLTADTETYEQALDAKGIAESKLEASLKKVEAYGAQISASSAVVEKAQAAVDKSVNDLSDTAIYSPMNGVVLKKLYSSGETVAAGYPVVAIGNINSVYVEVGVSDKYINSIKQGQNANIYVYGTNKEYTGTVEEIGSLADSTTRTFNVKIRVDNQNGEIRPGMVAKANLNISGESVCLVPVSSVIQLSSGSIIFTYDESTNTVSKKSVVTGDIIGDNIQIIEGISTGDVIVTEGQFLIKDGDKVIVQTENTETEVTE